MLHLELVHLLLAIHFDDERDDEDEESAAGDPGGLAGALEKLLGDDGGVGRSLAALEKDGGLRNGVGNPR